MALQRSPPTKYGSSPDMSTSGSTMDLNTRKRKPVDDIDHKLLTLLEIRLEKQMITLNDTITNNVTAAISSTLSDQLSTISSNLLEINSTLCKLTEENAVIKNSLSNTNSRLNNMEKSFNSSLEKQNQIESRLEALEVTGGINTDLVSQMRALETKIIGLEQYGRLNNLEISGLPENSKEDLSRHFLNIAKFLGVQTSPTDIVHISRTRPFKAAIGRPKAIVIKLNSRLLRDSILSAVRAKKFIRLCDIGFDGDVRKIYINEHLTPENKQLLKNTKEKAKTSEYQFVWIRDCKIFVRKNDTSPSIRIKDSSDLLKIK